MSFWLILFQWLLSQPDVSGRAGLCLRSQSYAEPVRVSHAHPDSGLSYRHHYATSISHDVCLADSCTEFFFLRYVALAGSGNYAHSDAVPDACLCRLRPHQKRELITSRDSVYRNPLL